MTTTSLVDAEVNAPRRRPNPGYRVAPPVTDAFTPWVSALDDELEFGEYRWILGPDGALVPIPIADKDEVAARPRRRLWSRRTQ